MGSRKKSGVKARVSTRQPPAAAGPTGPAPQAKMKKRPRKVDAPLPPELRRETRAMKRMKQAHLQGAHDASSAASEAIDQATDTLITTRHRELAPSPSHACVSEATRAPEATRIEAEGAAAETPVQAAEEAAADGSNQTSTHAPNHATPDALIEQEQVNITQHEADTHSENEGLRLQPDLEVDHGPESGNIPRAGMVQPTTGSESADHQPSAGDSNETSTIQPAVASPVPMYMFMYQGWSPPRLPRREAIIDAKDQPPSIPPAISNESPPSPEVQNPYFDKHFKRDVSKNEEEKDRWSCREFHHEAAMSICWGRWKSLETAISKFVWQVFPFEPLEPSAWESLNNDTKAQLLAICPKAADYIRSMLQGNLSLYETWIWHILVSSLFSPSCVDKWSGPEWSSFGRLDRTLRVGVDQTDNPYDFAYYNARQLMVRMLYMRHGSHADAERLQEVLLTQTGPVTRLRTPVLKPEHLEVLADIVDQAIKIDLVILGSRHPIVIEMQDPATGMPHSFPFDEDSTLTENIPWDVGTVYNRQYSPHGLPVELICVPLVRVFGERGRRFGTVNADDCYIGEVVRGYHVCEHFLPMRIFVDQFPSGEENVANLPEDQAQPADG